MSEQTTTTPQIDSGKDILMKAIRPYLLDPSKDYPEPYYMLEYNGVPFSTIGGLQAISGQKKNGKSFVLTQLMAAILGEDCDRVQHYLPGLRVPDRTVKLLGHSPRVLYVDTEMEMLNSAKVLRRVHWLCDWDMKVPMPNNKFNVLWLKTIKKESATDKEYQLRYRLIQQAIEALEPDVVFIDGLRDLLASINDEETATEILSNLATLAEERKMCIWNALHQNPTKDADEQKMRGWIGTELSNKVSDTLISIKNKTPNGVSFTVKQQDARGKDLDDWKFQITDDAGALGIPKITNTGSNLPSKSKEEILSDDIGEIHEWILKSKEMYEWPMSRVDIKKKVFREIGGVTNKDRQQADLMAAISMKYLEETTLKVNGYPMLKPADEYPF